MTLNFTGKIILITGATRGIGKQIAEDLLALGATLILTGTKPDQIADLNRQAKANGEKKTYLHLDFANSESVAQFFKTIDSYYKIDCLINNAGINKLNSVQNILAEDWDDMILTNLSGPFHIIKCVSKKMIENGFGRIINIASIFSKISKERRAAYSATKFGLHGLTVGVSNDLARYNILVNTLSPGFVMTDLTRKNLSEEEMAQLKEQVPAKRLAEVGDISSVALFLLSDHNRYLTGQNVIVDGGFTNV